MNPPDLRLCRSLLFLPASNPRAIEKARGLEADMIVLDLEDSVKEEDKAAAARRRRRSDACRASAGGRRRSASIRGGSPYYGEDVVAVRHSGADYIVLAIMRRCRRD